MSARSLVLISSVYCPGRMTGQSEIDPAHGKAVSLRIADDTTSDTVSRSSASPTPE